MRARCWIEPKGSISGSSGRFVNLSLQLFRLLPGVLLFSLAVKLPHCLTKADEQQAAFEFISAGANGRIPKLMQDGETNLKNFYNLAFGNTNPITGALDDLAVSNNGNAEKVLATGATNPYAFCYRYSPMPGFSRRAAPRPAPASTTCF